MTKNKLDSLQNNGKYYKIYSEYKYNTERGEFIEYSNKKAIQGCWEKVIDSFYI